MYKMIKKTLAIFFCLFFFCSRLVAYNQRSEITAATSGSNAENDLAPAQNDGAGPGGVSNNLAFWLKANAGMMMANSSSLNTATVYAEKSFLFCIRTGQDVSSRQVLYEQGGITRGINIYIDSNRLYCSAWNKVNDGAGSPWGFSAVDTPISPNREYIVSCVYQGNSARTGTLACHVNGELIGTNSHAGLLYAHAGGIGIAAMNLGAYFHDGAVNTGKGFYFGGHMAEIIGYNQALSPTDRQKVESYLAIKYGMTLRQNYIASDGSAIYPAATAHEDCVNDIAGIGRDDATALDQKKSKSVNAGESLTIVHSGAFNADRSFFICGHDGNAASLSADFDGGSNNRLARRWRVVETGAIGTVTIRLPITTATGLSHLLLSSDDSFPPNATAKIRMNINGGHYNAVVDPAHGQYFTFMSECPQLYAYTLVHQLDLPATPVNFNETPVPYSIDNRAAITFPCRFTIMISMAPDPAHWDKLFLPATHGEMPATSSMWALATRQPAIRIGLLPTTREIFGCAGCKFLFARPLWL